MKFTADILASIVDGDLYGDPANGFDTIVLDSRKPLLSGSALFVALSGKNHDGHRYIKSMADKGCKVFLAEMIPDGFDTTPVSIVIVKDSLKALQLLGTYKRDLFEGKVIGITGSNGKTIVKEWLSEVIGSRFNVIRSPRSYNSQTGVPLSAWFLEERYDYAILEAGISMPGEMEFLERIIKPDIGLITNIGDAHGENFSDIESKAIEKLLLFGGASVIIYPEDNDLLKQLIEEEYSAEQYELFSWTLTGRKASVEGKIIARNLAETSISVKCRGEEMIMEIPFSDRASIENCMSVITASLTCGLSLEQIKEGVSSLMPVAMRMEMKRGINNTMIIGDYYNSDPVSLRVGIEYLENHRDNGATIILSDFVQCGDNQEILYGEVADLINSSGVTRFIGIGKNLSRYHELFQGETHFYDSTSQFLAEFNTGKLGNEIILLKGARSFGFERISGVLEFQSHQTVLEINLDAITHNLSQIRKVINPGTKIMAMVKAFAYGSGAAEIASHLEFCRVDYLAVAYADEGVALRASGITIPILVMNPEKSAFETIIRYDLEPEIYSFQMLHTFLETASRFGLTDFPVHIKVDTGMHRLGFGKDECEVLAAVLASTEIVKVVSIFSHLSASDDPEYDGFTVKQADLLIEMADLIQDSLGYKPFRHILNSSGIYRFPEYQFEMVRVGIGMYGVGVESAENIIPVARFISMVSQVKTVPAGDPVGYGCRGVAEEEREIAIIPVGYADGLDIRLSEGNGELFVNGSLVPVVGRVCMDMCMVDVTGLAVSEGDQVEIFGENITVEHLAKMSGTIPYDIITGISPRVKRVYLKE